MPLDRIEALMKPLLRNRGVMKTRDGLDEGVEEVRGVEELFLALVGNQFTQERISSNLVLFASFTETMRKQ